MKAFNKKVWFVTGSQDLYGQKVLDEVAVHTSIITDGLNQSTNISAEVLNKGTVKSAQEIIKVCQAANNDDDCVGLILWMHTFSPAKMWIAGLSQLNKPFAHLHTQFNAALPWDKIDMNFMNTNQSAHGCREFGFIGTTMQLERKVIVGHWQDTDVHQELDDWIRAAMGLAESRNLKVARFGDNMRNVAVTDGNKVSAQIKLGFEVHAYGVGDLVGYIDQVSETAVDDLVQVYKREYRIEQLSSIENGGEQQLRNEARLELAMETFLIDHGCKAFTNCFENLHGMTNLPGLATQRLMAKGYGYGGEGDWKTAAMTRIIKVMGSGLEGGCSFMEDYTYHFGQVDLALGAHMLEVCPTIAKHQPSLEIHRHTIGCDCLVPRLIFTGKEGVAINVSLVDLGSRFRLILNELKSVTPEANMPNLPVASTLWQPMPNLKVAAAAWIYAGGAHHSTYSQAISSRVIDNFAEMLNLELVIIDEETNLRCFKQELKQNDFYYTFNR